MPLTVKLTQNENRIKTFTLKLRKGTSNWGGV